MRSPSGRLQNKVMDSTTVLIKVPLSFFLRLLQLRCHVRIYRRRRRHFHFGVVAVFLRLPLDVGR